MVKECPIIINNEYVTVVRYGDIEIQFPSIHRDSNKVLVEESNGEYFIVESKVSELDKPEEDTDKKVVNKRGKKKSATIE